MNHHDHIPFSFVLFMIMALTFTGMLAGLAGVIVSTQTWQLVLGGLVAGGGGAIFCITLVMFILLCGGQQ